MKSKHIPMTFEEFEVMPRPFGWKAEYWDGHAHLSPREAFVSTKILLAPRDVSLSVHLTPVETAFKPRMVEAFFDAFEDAVEFCDWCTEQIRSHAEKNINDYFQGVRGKPLPVSVMALQSVSDRVIGLALFVEKKEGHAELDLLFVLPSRQRRGIATQMVTGSVNRLYNDGVRELRSAHHICNEQSRDWHHNYGFRVIPDPYYCRMKYSWHRHEIWRREKLGISEDLDALRRKRDEWQARLPEEWDY